MEEVIPGIFIGDYAASQDFNHLKNNKIYHLVSAMRQKYDTPTEFTVHRVLVDDVPTANIISSFESTNYFIRQALDKGGKVLVHCQAGQSRSATLIAAYLMSEKVGMETGEAIGIVRKARSQIEPSESFIEQLEMYERSQCEWNPSKWIEQRRFLMDGMATQVQGKLSSFLTTLLTSLN